MAQHRRAHRAVHVLEATPSPAGETMPAQDHAPAPALVGVGTG